MNLAAALMAAALWLVALPASGLPLDLSAEEKAWIAAHPVVRMAVDPSWKPIQYIENGQHAGLASEYVSAIERQTGLKFVMVPHTGWDEVTDKLARADVDVLPVALRQFTSPEVGKYLDFTDVYYVGSIVVVTRDRFRSVFHLDRLDGSTVALKSGGAYFSLIRRLYPGVKVLPTQSAEEALLAVIDGRADAALGLEAGVLPLLRRKYDGMLHVSGVLAHVPLELAMGVRKDLPMLRGILDKALDSLTAKETDEMDARWLEHADYGAPSLQVLLRYYRVQISLAVVGLLLIALSALYAHRQHRLAVRSEREKSMFLAVMSHEIRSPMHAILASMELLQRSVASLDARRLVGIVAGGAQNLLRLLDDVLDMSKLDAGRVQLQPHPLDIMELTRNITDLLAVQSRDQGTVLTVQERRPIARRVLLDPLRVGQIVRNLVCNAIKFTPGGSVSVSPWLEIHNGEGVLHIEVADTGIGMDDSTRQRLFQPYCQGSAVTSGQFGGTGLGLAICRELVQLMHGSMEVDSAPGRGTTITVHIPCQTVATEVERPSDNDGQETNPAPTMTGTTLRVLVVEDSLINQEVLLAQLSSLNCTTDVAASGSAAMRALGESSYDIVLCDCDLPDMSGYELTREWRLREAARNHGRVPILAVSASTDHQHMTACFDSGMDGVLTKPYTLEKLRDALQLWCGRTLATALHETTDHLDPSEIRRALLADVEALRSACMSNDHPAAMHSAHRLVGAAEALGANSLVQAARLLEAGIKSPTPAASLLSTGLLDEIELLARSWTPAQR
ncbi:histidine kinase [Bordetella sputigena]|uniref:ATP-binding protein n=1 Tax=Bordetella sputigena TaxID=1416810 RepID=UPI0039EDF745